MIKVIGIEHVGIAVKSREKTSNFFKNILGLSNPITENIKDQKVLTEIFDTSNGKLELLESTSENSPIHKFVEKQGNTVHHIALISIRPIFLFQAYACAYYYL